ncbi:glutathione S-transferase L3-like [Primulina eburnea]|uniref:glutathione S-transferase L3-like n=1 Tax=Primulina eburnea TaxID=1245227 RepID=UPI003C6C11DC
MLEVLPPVLDLTSDQPPLFDGTTRLYINYMSPYAQRVWIVRNYMVCPFKHNDQVIGESLYLIKYVDDNFDGPALLPDQLDLIVWKLASISLRMDHSSLVDVVYAPFVERIKVTFEIIFKHDFMPAGQSSQHGLRQ